MKRRGENVIRQGLPRLRVVLQVFTACKLIAWVMRSSRPCSTVTSQSSVLRGFSASCQLLRGWLVFDDRHSQIEVRKPIRATESVAPMKARRRTIFTSGERHGLKFHASREGNSAKTRAPKKVLAPDPPRLVSRNLYWPREVTATHVRRRAGRNFAKASPPAKARKLTMGEKK